MFILPKKQYVDNQNFSIHHSAAVWYQQETLPDMNQFDVVKSIYKSLVSVLN